MRCAISAPGDPGIAASGRQSVVGSGNISLPEPLQASTGHRGGAGHGTPGTAGSAEPVAWHLERCMAAPCPPPPARLRACVPAAPQGLCPLQTNSPGGRERSCLDTGHRPKRNSSLGEIDTVILCFSRGQRGNQQHFLPGSQQLRVGAATPPPPTRRPTGAVSCHGSVSASDYLADKPTRGSRRPLDPPQGLAARRELMSTRGLLCGGKCRYLPGERGPKGRWLGRSPGILCRRRCFSPEVPRPPVLLGLTDE